MSLSESQKTKFMDVGYLALPELFSPSELEPLRMEIAAIVEQAALKMHHAGQITDLHADASFETRLAKLLSDHPELTSEYLRAIEGKGGGRHSGREMFNIITHPRLLDIMQSLVGPEIIGSSVYRVRPKAPA